MRLKDLSVRPVQWLVATGFAAWLASECLWVVSAYQDWSTAQTNVERWERQRAEVARQTPPPTNSERMLAERAVSDEQARVARLLEACGSSAERPAPPRTRPEAFFELAAWIEGLREEARRQGVEAREDECFGFRSYAQQGPALAQLERVHRQRLAAGELLKSLFAAGPHRFEGLQRVDPMPPGSLSRGPRDETDYFPLAASLAVALPERATSEAFRLRFVGHTRMLRVWLNHLASQPGPVLVRDLMVEPRHSTAPAPGETAAEGGDGVRFTVVVIVVQWKPAVPAESASP